MPTTHVHSMANSLQQRPRHGNIQPLHSQTHFSRHYMAMTWPIQPEE